MCLAWDKVAQEKVRGGDMKLRSSGWWWGTRVHQEHRALLASTGQQRSVLGMLHLPHHHRSGNLQVAVKRIGDVLASLDNAKRVLRELCILKRLDHPCIIRLLDVFLKPSPTGACPCPLSNNSARP